MLEEIISKTTEMYKTNRFVNINLNVLAAAAPAFIAAGIVSEIFSYAQYSKEAIAVAGLVADMIVYFPLQGFLHYRVNREQYLDEDEVNVKKGIKDFAHLYATKIPARAVMLPIAPILQYNLMDQGIGAGVASQISYWGLTLVTRTIHSIIGWRTGLFKTTKPSGL